MSVVKVFGQKWVAVEMFDPETVSREAAVSPDSPAHAVAAVFGSVGDAGRSLFEWCGARDARGFLFTGFTTWVSPHRPTVTDFEEARAYDLSCVDPSLFETVDTAPVWDRVAVSLRNWWTLEPAMRGVLWVAGTVSCVVHGSVVLVSAPSAVVSLLNSR